MATIKPTLKDPVSPQSEKFEKDFRKTMVRSGLPQIRETGSLNEVDGLLTEKEQSLKKKIFSLAKMEALVFADPKLSAVYEDMAENGEEKYGYHYNETIQNMIFNDYVLNSPTYLQKYKMAIPKEKKRRDKSGINKLKKAGAEKMAQSGLPKQKQVSEEELEESTSAGSAGGAAGYVGYAGPSAWGKEGDLSSDFKKNNKGNTGVAKPINKPISKVVSIGESKKNYITDPTPFKKYIEVLNEESDAQFVLNNSQAYGSIDNMDPQNQKIIKKDIQTGKMDSNHNIKDGIALQEKEYNPDMYSTEEDYKRLVQITKEKTGKGLTKDHIPMLAGQALYNLAIKLAGQLLPLGWDDLADINSMWDYIDENGGMTYDNLVAAVKEAVNDRLSEEGMGLDDLNEKAKSKAQQRFMGAVNAYKGGELSADDVSADIERAADSMTDKEVHDFASTKHKGLPDHVDENLGQPDVDYLVKAYEIINSGPNYDPAKAEHFRQNLTQMDDAQAQQVSRTLDDMVKKMGFQNPRDVMNYENNVNEDTQTMIQNNGTSMSNKAQPTGDMSSNVDMGAQQTSGLQESDIKLLEDINKELEAFSIHHDKLKLMSEDKKTTSQILNKRVTDENPKNFKKDFKDSDTKDVIDVEKELMWKDQQTDVGDDPQKLGADIEKNEIKTADMKSDEALKNVGDSTNNDGDEVPKRNLTTKEQDEVNLYRNGQHSLTYDNDPGERFVERMKADQGEFFEMGEKQKEFKKGAASYNKDPQRVQPTDVDKMQYDKNVKEKGEKVAWNERMGLGSNVKLAESMVTGRYIDILGKRRLMEFRIGEVREVKTLKEGVMALNFDGLGNTYMNRSIDNKVIVNEGVVGIMESHKFHTDGKYIFAIKNPVQSLNEGEIKEKPVVNEQMDKMKHLLGYKPESYVSTKGVKNNRKF